MGETQHDRHKDSIMKVFTGAKNENYCHSSESIQTNPGKGGNVHPLCSQTLAMSL